MRIQSNLIVLGLTLLSFSCQKEDVNVSKTNANATTQEQLNQELVKIQKSTFKEIPLDQIPENNKFVSNIRKSAGFLRLKNNKIFQQLNPKGPSVQDEITKKQFEALIVPELLPLLSITEEHYNEYRPRIESAMNELTPEDLNSIEYTSSELTPELWTEKEFAIAKALYSNISSLISADASVSVVLQSINSFEVFIRTTPLISDDERDHLLNNIGFVKVVISENVTEGCDAGCQWRCAAKMVMPIIIGAAFHDGPGVLEGFVVGAWNAFDSGCISF